MPLAPAVPGTAPPVPNFTPPSPQPTGELSGPGATPRPVTRAPGAPPPPPGAAGGFEQLHPRGRGGLWIKKGAGYGPQGPDQTTAQLQERLRQLGFNVQSDGKFGPATEQAVKAFQNRYGLQPTGAVDPATAELLQTPPDETLAQVRAAQAALKQHAGTLAKAKGASAAVTRHGTVGTGKGSGASRRGGGAASGASTRQSTKGGPAGTNASVTGVGHLGTGLLKQGTGMSGKPDPAVSNLQASLAAAGYKVAKDGRFGPKTEAAVKNLQKDYGLKVDGIVGPETKALLAGLGSAKAGAKAKPATKTKAATKTTNNALAAKEVATLRTKSPHPRHGSRTAGSRMLLKPPKPKPATLKYSADDQPEPDLEETTVAFGNGGDPSLSIKDFRSEGEPPADRPVWDPIGARADVPNLEIPDADSYRPYVPTWIGGAISDGRTALGEAVAARKAATNGRDFARARARETLLRERLQEVEAVADAAAWDPSKHPRGRGGKWVDVLAKLKAREKKRSLEIQRQELLKALIHGPSALTESSYTEALHPRGRGGKWVDVLGKLKALPTNKPGKIDGIMAMKLSTGHYAASVGSEMLHDKSAEHVARAIGAHLEHQDELRAHGERAVSGLSPEAAREFTRDWALRGDEEGLPERHEMWSQVYDEDPMGFVRDVFSSELSPEARKEAEKALADAQERAAHKGSGGTAQTNSDLLHAAADVLAAGPSTPYKERIMRDLKAAAAEAGGHDALAAVRRYRLAEAVAARKAATDSRTFVRARAREEILRQQLQELEEAIGHIEKGAFHRWLGKPLDAPITDADIAKGLAAGGHPAKMAAFAKAAKGFSHKRKKKKTVQEAEYRWLDEHAEEWLPTDEQLEESEKTAGYSSTHAPLGKPGGPGLWKHKGLQLPAYIQNVARGIMKTGKTMSAAIASAIAVVKRWAAGGGNVHPEVRAAAAKAVAEWEKLKASH